MASKTKIYLAFIAAGLIALAVDRCSIGASAPDTTEASLPDAAEDQEVVPQTPAARPRPAAKQVGPSKLSVPELRFPRNLPPYDPAIELRDVFARRAAEGSAPDGGAPNKPGSAKKNAVPDAIGREAFLAAHRLDAVMVQESLKIAVVDGRWVRVGDTVDTCTLTRIEGDSVVFECHDGDTVLSPAGKRRQPPG